MKYYLRFLAICYFVGFILHGADLLDLRLKFSAMASVWQAWIVYLAMSDLIAAIGLWKLKRWGVFFFILIAVSQLFAYIVFRSFFGVQNFLIGFHVFTLSIYIFFKLQKDVNVRKGLGKNLNYGDESTR